MHFHYFAAYYLNFHCNLISGFFNTRVFAGFFVFLLLLLFFADGHLTSISDFQELLNIK